jgi:GntR family transcriptional regulator
VKQRIEQPISVLTGFSDEMKARGIQPETRVLESFIRTATAEEALTLSLKPGQQVAFLKRLRLADGKPVAVEYSVLPRHILPNPYVITGSLYSYLKMQKKMPVRALQHLRANIVSSSERDLLQASDDTAVLYITRVGYLGDGTPVEFTHSYYRGDSYDFIAELQTEKASELPPQRGRSPL